MLYRLFARYLFLVLLIVLLVDHSSTLPAQAANIDAYKES
ncbi:hypothetical protein NIES22_43560 [Calothrix brevissima NIES-22]|nr:hypothetical protein NIES22_43560 [Calothrix brevissima NIES-22]